MPEMPRNLFFHGPLSTLKLQEAAHRDFLLVEIFSRTKITVQKYRLQLRIKAATTQIFQYHEVFVLQLIMMV